LNELQKHSLTSFQIPVKILWGLAVAVAGAAKDFA